MNIKKYYYLKLKDNFFDCEEIKILESLPNGIYYSNLLIKLYLKSLKFDGALKFNEYIPYDENMIATITNLNIDTVRRGLKVLAYMNFIDKLDNGTIYMMNIQSFIGKASNEADRKKAYRKKIVEKKLQLEDSKYEGTNLGQSKDKCPSDDGTNFEQVEDERPNDDGTSCTYFLDKLPPETRDKSTETRDKSIETTDKSIEYRDTDRDKDKDIVNESINLVNDFEKLTGHIGGVNLEAVELAVKMHGAENVKKAMHKAIERGRPKMFYINGILKNWASEGDSKGGEYYGNRSSGKDNEAGANEFADFKPHKSRTLTEEERISIEKELI